MESSALSYEEIATLTNRWTDRVDRIARESDLGGMGTLTIKIIMTAVRYVLENDLTPENAIEHMEEELRKFELEHPPLPPADRKPSSRRTPRKRT